MLGDGERAERLLALTGLDADQMRANITDPGQSAPMLAAVLEFLARHEPDLLAAADALQVDPAALIAAQEALSR